MVLFSAAFIALSWNQRGIDYLPVCCYNTLVKENGHLRNTTNLIIVTFSKLEQLGNVPIYTSISETETESLEYTANLYKREGTSIV